MQSTVTTWKQRGWFLSFFSCTRHDSCHADDHAQPFWFLPGHHIFVEILENFQPPQSKFLPSFCCTDPLVTRRSPILSKKRHGFLLSVNSYTCLPHKMLSSAHCLSFHANYPASMSGRMRLSERIGQSLQCVYWLVSNFGTTSSSRGRVYLCQLSVPSSEEAPEKIQSCLELNDAKRK